MSFLLRKIAPASFASFVEEGTIVGEEENIVSRDWYPDSEADLGVYSSLGCLLGVTPEVKEEEDSDYCPQADGTWELEDDPVVVQDALKISCKCHFEIIHRLTWGFKNKIVNGTPQVVFGNKRRFVAGWLIFEQRIPGGITIINAAIWVHIRLDGAPTWNKDATRPAIRVVKKYSPLNTGEPKAIV